MGRCPDPVGSRPNKARSASSLEDGCQWHLVSSRSNTGCSNPRSTSVHSPTWDNNPNPMANGAQQRSRYGQGTVRNPMMQTDLMNQEPLTSQVLNAARPEEQKQMLGEKLYPIIQSMQPELAGKITGMLLEMENSEILHMLEDSASLTSKVNEAVAVLQAHQQKLADQQKIAK